MPLDPAQLEIDLAALFAAPDLDSATLATQWSDAFEAYAAGIVPASSKVASAGVILQANLKTTIDLAPASGFAGFDTGFALFAAEVGLGMAPAFTPFAPPGAPGMAAEASGPHPATHAAAATKWRTFFDAWMKLGTATPSGGGPPVLWT